MRPQDCGLLLTKLERPVREAAPIAPKLLVQALGLDPEQSREIAIQDDALAANIDGWDATWALVIPRCDPAAGA